MGKIETHLIDGNMLRFASTVKAPRAPLVLAHQSCPRISRNWPASPGARQHGHEFLGAGWHAGEHAAVFWIHLSWRGRMMSRHEAKRQVRGETLKKELEAQGIHIRAARYLVWQKKLQKLIKKLTA